MKQFLLVGDPVDRSRSPDIHAAMIDLARIDAQYTTRRVDEVGLEVVVEELRTAQIHGVNVTMPYKQLAASLCDILVGAAEESGSVNTLRMTSKGVEGQSTDSSVFAALIESDHFQGVSSIHILGSGGSARAALSVMGDRDVYVSSRRPETLDDVSESFQRVPWGSGVAGSLLINTTPLGMSGEELPPRAMASAAGLIDLPYADSETPAVLWSRENEKPFFDGHQFLVSQAIDSFNLWTGVDLEFVDVAARL